MNIIAPLTIEASQLGAGCPAEPSGVGDLWAPGPYPGVGAIRVRPNTNRRYQSISAHDSSTDRIPPELSPDRWLDLGPTTVPVEALWAAYTIVAKGDEVIRLQTHRRYRATAALTAMENVVVPELDPTLWLDIGPTNRWATFDNYSNTRAYGLTSITYVINPSYFNAIALYGLVGLEYAVTVKDGPGGTVLFTRSGFLLQDAVDLYDYLFGENTPLTKLVFTDIPLSPAAEVTITISAGTDQPVGIGMIVLGDFTSLIGELAEWGGTQYGATAEPITYSYIDTDDYGNTSIVRRHSATNLRCQVELPRIYADAAVQKLQNVLDKPVACIATTHPGYAGLNSFGLIASSPVSYDSYNTASIDVTVKALI